MNNERLNKIKELIPSIKFKANWIKSTNEGRYNILYNHYAVILSTVMSPLPQVIPEYREELHLQITSST